MSRQRTNAEYGAARDAELLRTFDRLMQEAPAGKSVASLFERLVEQPASRFYVSELRAIRVITAMRRGSLRPGSSRSRGRMYAEVNRRVERLLAASPEMSLADAVVEVVNSPAPEFYMEPASARVTVYGLLRRRRNMRRQARAGRCACRG
ncbi:MAG: hypothetical protein K2O24_08060 [Muribaculaceae bacterium]|nr:hypothetical protein [Muribaculaceae bacterium]